MIKIYTSPLTNYIYIYKYYLLIGVGGTGKNYPQKKPLKNIWLRHLSTVTRANFSCVTPVPP